MKPTRTIGYAAAILILAASANAATTFVPGVLKRVTYNGQTRIPTGGGPGRGVSVNSDAITNGTVLASLATESGAPTNAAIIAEYAAGTTVVHAGGAGTNILGGKRMIFFSGTREYNGGSGDTAGVLDLTAEGVKVFINAVKYMAGAGKTNVLFVSPHGADNTPTTGAAGNGFTVAPDKGYTDLLKANGFNVTRLVQTGTPTAATVNTYDLVIVGRACGSGNFQNASADNWNAITAPLMDMGGYHTRNNRLGLTSGNTIPDTVDGAALKVTTTNPGHPIFVGVNLANPIIATPVAYAKGWITNAPTSITFPTSWDVPDDNVDNFSAIYSGLISVNQGGLYDLYLAADDDTDLYISTDDSPTNKYWVAQEVGWSGVRGWITANGGGSTTAQKSSATFGLGRYANGIQLNANTKYYLEGVYHGGGGGNFFAVTLTPHGTAPFDNDATTLTNATSSYGFTTTIGINIATPTILNITSHPSNKTVYASMAAVFKVNVTSDSETGVGYQWRRNGVNIPGATGASYTLMASTNDTGATFDCVVQAPSTGPAVLSKTSGVATLTVQPLSGATIVQGMLKRELINAQTGAVLTNLETGNVPAPNTIAGVAGLDLGNPGADIAERVSGFFTPAATGSYVVFLASDDQSKFFISTDDQPKNKRWVAEETIWSNNREWTASGGGSLLPQKDSRTFSADGGLTAPYANGISLQGGQKYYIEALHYNGGGGNGLSATIVTLANAPAVITGDPTTLSNNVLSYATSPINVFAITNQPQSKAVFEGDNYTFVVGVNTDSEITPVYQWKKNGQIITNANGTSFIGTLANIADNGAQFTCDISLPGKATLTTVPAVLSVNKAAFAVGQVKYEAWYSDATTRAIVGANVPGTFPLPNESTFITGFDLGGQGHDNYVSRLSGFFVPPATGIYVFYLCSDDDSDLYLSPNDRPEGKVLIAQESGWSNQRNWNTVGAGNPVTQKHSDTFSPDNGVTFPGNPGFIGGLQLTGGSRYYIEAVHHNGTGGDNVAVTYGRYDPNQGIVTNAPVDGNLSRMTGTSIGVLVPGATTLTITNEPQDATVYASYPAYFSIGATSDGVLPPTYQWRINGTNVPNAIYRNFGWITSTNDNGLAVDCIVGSPGTSLVRTSLLVHVTVQAGAVFTTGSLNREVWGPNLGTADRQTVEGGGFGPPTTVDTVDSLDIRSFGDLYVQRVRGLFIPPTTGNYVFYVASDDDTDVFLGTTDQPSSKRLICQVTGYDANPLQWEAATSGSTTQKRSDQWSADGGITMPWASGIPLTAGGHYYLEAVHHDGTGGDFVGVTYTMLGEAVPTNNTPALLVSSTLARFAAPVSTRPVLTVTKVGNNLNISWAPAGGTLKSSADLSAPYATWTTVGTANPATVPIGAGNLFLHVEQ